MPALITRTLSIRTGGAAPIHLHLETAGPEEGPLVVLLHGFPEYWGGWRAQMTALAAAGFHVVAPDQRGYGLSEKPHGVSAYSIESLSADVIAIFDHFHQEKVILIGHDWGAAVAWHTAIHFPERVARLGILNVPHPGALTRAIADRASGQLRRSWYILFFQIPWLPEMLLRLGNFAGMRRMMQASSLSNTFSTEDMRRYVEMWSRPGALTSMVNWYRAAVRDGLHLKPGGFFRASQARLSMPTLILWGLLDIALIPRMANDSLQYCDNGKLITYPQASHWVQHDEADAVSAALIDFFQT